MTKSIKCKICGKIFRMTKSGEPSVWLKKHFTKDKKHYDAIVPPGLVFETAAELSEWFNLRLRER